MMDVNRRDLFAAVALHAIVKRGNGPNVPVPGDKDTAEEMAEAWAERMTKRAWLLAEMMDKGRP